MSTEVEDVLREVMVQRERAEKAENALKQAETRHAYELKVLQSRMNALKKENEMRKKVVEKLLWEEDKEKEEDEDAWGDFEEEDQEEEIEEEEDEEEEEEPIPPKVAKPKEQQKVEDDRHNELMCMAKQVMAELDLEKEEIINGKEKTEILSGQTVRFRVGDPNTRPRNLPVTPKPDPPKAKIPPQDFTTPHRYPCPTCLTDILSWVDRCPSCGMPTSKEGLSAIPTLSASMPDSPKQQNTDEISQEDDAYEYDLLKPRKPQRTGVKPGVKQYKKSQKAQLNSGKGASSAMRL